MGSYGEGDEILRLVLGHRFRQREGMESSGGSSWLAMVEIGGEGIDLAVEFSHRLQQWRVGFEAEIYDAFVGIAVGGIGLLVVRVVVPVFEPMPADAAPDSSSPRVKF